MKKINCTVFAVILMAGLISCEKSKDAVVDEGYSQGIFIVNEGSYNNNNGSISFVDESNTLIINDIFYAANQRPLGDIVQSFSIVNDSLGIIVVNNSAKLEIVRLRTFQAISEPLNVIYPRYFLQVTGEKGYLTSGNLEGKVYVTDLNTMSIEDSINVGYGPETLLKSDNRVYVANSGGWGSDSTISVINVSSDEVEGTIFVEKVPVDMVLDQDNFLWVYCKGYTNYSDIETDSYIQKINTSDNSIMWQGRVGSALDYSTVPAKCAVSSDGATIYYIRPDGIYKLDASNPVISEEPVIPGNFYGLDVHPENGRIYVFETVFTGNGTMKIYEPDGTLFGQGIVGIGPNAAVFSLQ